MADEIFDLGFSGMQMELDKLILALDRMSDDVDGNALQAMEESAEIIAAEQKRLLAAAHFRKPTADLASLIRVHKAKNKRYYHLRIGYDSEAIHEHPELLVIEFGRPGKSARRSGKTDSLKRKKGDFPPVTPHIRAGLDLSKDKAAANFRDKIMEIVRRRWENGG